MKIGVEASLVQAYELMKIWAYESRTFGETKLIWRSVKPCN